MSPFQSQLPIILSAVRPMPGAIILQSSAPTVLDQGLVSFTLSAASTAGEIINGVTNPSVVAGGTGAGVHQVWMPLLGQTPTQGDHNPLAFNPAWKPYDSFWFFDSGNSLSVGGAFTETLVDDPAPITLPPSPAGPPRTGFGTMGFSGASASKGFTIASGRQGTNVPYGQFVLKQGEHALVSLTVLDNTGSVIRINNFPIGLLPNTPPVATDADLGFVSAAIIHHQFTAADENPAGLTWSNLTLTSPIAPAVPATLSPSGRFEWHAIGTPNNTRFTYTATVSDSGNPALSDTATLTFHYFVPEPATIALAPLAMVAFMMRKTR
jgi:hypothetical protein